MNSVNDPDVDFLGFKEISLLVARTCDHLFPVERARHSSESARSEDTQAHREDDPQAALGKWIAYILFRTRLPTLTVMHALHLLLRISLLGDENIPLSFFSPTSPAAMGTSSLHYRLVLASFILATAYSMDDAYSIRSWAIACQFTFPVREIDRMQLDMLDALGWRLQAEGERMELIVQVYEDEWLAELASRENVRWREDLRRRAKLSQILGVPPETISRPASSHSTAPTLIVPPSPMVGYQRTPRTPRTPAPPCPCPNAAPLPLATLHWRDWVVSRSGRRSRSQERSRSHERPPRPPPSPAPAGHSSSGWRVGRQSWHVSQDQVVIQVPSTSTPVPNSGDVDEAEDSSASSCFPCRSRRSSRPSQESEREKPASLAPPSSVEISGDEAVVAKSSSRSVLHRRGRSADSRQSGTRHRRVHSRGSRDNDSVVQEKPPISQAPSGGRPPPPSIMVPPTREDVAPWEAQDARPPRPGLPFPSRADVAPWESQAPDPPPPPSLPPERRRCHLRHISADPVPAAGPTRQRLISVP